MNGFAPYNTQHLSCAAVQGASCIGSWNDLLIVGRSDGSLSIFKETPNRGDPMNSLVWKPHSVKRLGQKIFQLVVSVDRSSVFCLTDEGVSLYSLPQLMMKGQAGKTRGSTCFSWDDDANRLAVGLRKRVVLYDYDGLEFVFKREFTVSDEPVSLQVVGTTVFVATKKEYIAVLSSGQHVKLDKVESQPCAISASQRHALVTRNIVTEVFDENGKSVPEVYGPWTSKPTTTVVSGRHVIAISPDALQVQLFGPRSGINLIQRIDIRGYDIINPRTMNDGVFVASSGTGQVVCFLPVSKVQQAEQLLGAEAYEDALAVSRDMLSSQEKVQTDLEARIRLAYGRKLLIEQKYEEGMLNLGMSSYCHPMEILQSFPFLVPDALAHTGAFDTSEHVQKMSEQDIPKIVTILIPYLLSFRSRLASGSASTVETSGASSEFPIDVLIDTALLKAFLSVPDNGALLQFVQRPNSIDLESGSEALQDSGRYAELVALYKTHGRHAAALKLLEQLTTKVDELKVPPSGAAMELTGLPGVWAAIQYLSSHEPRDFSLISFHSKWILKMDPDSGVEMFVHMYPDVHPSVVLPILNFFGSELAASYLAKIVEEAGAEEKMFHQDLAILYLKDANSHDKLCKLVLTSDYVNFEVLLRLLPPKGAWNVRAAIYERLDRRLDTIRILYHHLGSLELAEAYCDRVAMKQMKKSGLPLKVQNGRSAALPGETSIYALLVQVMIEEDDVDHPGAYKKANCGPDDRRWKEVALLLSRKSDAIDPLIALSLLPQEIPLPNCKNFLETAMRAISEERRKAKIISNLYRARHLAALFSVTDAQQTSVTITQDRACWICHKRLGGKKGLVPALVHFPGGSIAHYSCYKSQLSSN